ncbi:MAG: hypothetical protein LBC03_01325 [Nitrososphaerota archaeon]|nr:hypothetical protein [Nitrososphaerota archaeon]
MFGGVISVNVADWDVGVVCIMECLMSLLLGKGISTVTLTYRVIAKRFQKGSPINNGYARACNQWVADYLISFAMNYVCVVV